MKTGANGVPVYHQDKLRELVRLRDEIKALRTLVGINSNKYQHLLQDMLIYQRDIIISFGANEMDEWINKASIVYVIRKENELPGDSPISTI